MKLLKFAILAWAAIALLGACIAHPGLVFLLIIAGTLYGLFTLTFGSLDYWRRYHDHVYGDSSEHQ